MLPQIFQHEYLVRHEVLDFKDYATYFTMCATSGRQNVDTREVVLDYYNASIAQYEV